MTGSEDSELFLELILKTFDLFYIALKMTGNKDKAEDRENSGSQEDVIFWSASSGMQPGLHVTAVDLRGNPRAYRVFTVLI